MLNDIIKYNCLLPVAVTPAGSSHYLSLFEYLLDDQNQYMMILLKLYFI